MFLYRYFLSEFMRLKKCKRGVFVIVFVIVFSSFLIAADTIMDAIKIIETKNILDYIAHKSLADSLIIDSSNYFNANPYVRMSIIKRNLETNLFNYYPELSQADTTYIIDHSSVFINDNPSVSSFFRVGLSIEYKIKLRSFILNALGKNETFDVIILKNARAKYNISLLVIPYKWSFKVIRSSQSSKDIRRSFLDNFFPIVKNDNLCVAPYDYDKLIFWRQGILKYSMGITYTYSDDQSFYRARWDHSPYDYAKKLLNSDDNKHNYVVNSILVDPCFLIDKNVKQVKLVLLIGEEKNLSNVDKNNYDIENICDTVKGDGKNGRGDIIEIFALGISPDDATRNILKRCAGSSRYFELNSPDYRAIQSVSSSLGKRIIDEINGHTNLSIS